jgi:hypothetical protein
MSKSTRRAVAQLARVPVSKTGGWGFKSLLPCSVKKLVKKKLEKLVDRKEQQ